jgi:hypothetical protein
MVAADATHYSATAVLLADMRISVDPAAWVIFCFSSHGDRFDSNSIAIRVGISVQKLFTMSAGVTFWPVGMEV